MTAAIEIVRAVRWQQNCYVVRNAGEAIVIDPGAERIDIERAIGAARVVGILFTHGHYDHIASASALCFAHQVPCRVHERDRQLLAHAAVYALSFERLSLAIPGRVETFDARATFTVGGSALSVIETPGHTPGSVTFQLGSTLFTGDTLLWQRPGRTDLPGGDERALQSSIDALLRRADLDRILPGHGREWTVTAARSWRTS